MPSSEDRARQAVDAVLGVTEEAEDDGAEVACVRPVSLGSV